MSKESEFSWSCWFLQTLHTTPDWSLQFELMCDASDYTMGVVLGQRKNKFFIPYTMLEGAQ